MLLKLKGIGPEFAAILWSEGLFRHYDNRRQLAAYAGLAPTPWQSGQIDREQGRHRHTIVGMITIFSAPRFPALVPCSQPRLTGA
jgi:transposase